jgi:hypothetical protein
MQGRLVVVYAFDGAAAQERGCHNNCEKAGPCDVLRSRHGVCPGLGSFHFERGPHFACNSKVCGPPVGLNFGPWSRAPIEQTAPAHGPAVALGVIGSPRSLPRISHWMLAADKLALSHNTAAAIKCRILDGGPPELRRNELLSRALLERASGLGLGGSAGCAAAGRRGRGRGDGNCDGERCGRCRQFGFHRSLSFQNIAVGNWWSVHRGTRCVGGDRWSTDHAKRITCPPLTPKMGHTQRSRCDGDHSEKRNRSGGFPHYPTRRNRPR